MERAIFIAGALLALVAVAAGAFGAHALKTRLSKEMLDIFEVAVRYQMYHALALLATSWALSRWPGTPAVAAAWLFLAGTIVFSGSLYVLVLSGWRWMGGLTPLGGLAFLAGWLCLVWHVVARASRP